MDLRALGGSRVGDKEEVEGEVEGLGDASWW